MTIKPNKIVTMSYLLKNDSGEELDRSEPGTPLIYLHGQGQIVPGLERQLEGLKKGDKKAQIKVPASEAYGELRPDLLLKVSRAQFPKDAEIEEGMQFWAHSPDGQKHPFTVVGMSDDQIEIDGNHPLAGENLNFDIEIEEVRDATEEELAHGHAHGPGGHEH